MGIIRQLDKQLANKIAAGEVIERPANVVKELVENSIDASARSISIYIEEGGMQLIKVIDDGDGMDAIDARMCIKTHATSKIKDDFDLFNITTLGFRGEAIPSIASISQFELKTSQGMQGYRAFYDFGELKEEGETDAKKGTTITVSKLFHNVPARLKYLKSVNSEFSHIQGFVEKFALANPQIAFSLYHQDRLIFRTSGNGQLIEVIGQIYGLGVAKNMIKVEFCDEEFSISGYISKIDTSRASKANIITLINQRVVRNLMTIDAVNLAYRDYLASDRYPIAFINIEIDPYLVDVNVHPSKLEVRFSKEQELFAAVETAIKDVFKQETLIPEPAATDKTTRNQPKQNYFTFEQQSRPTEKDDIPWEDLLAKTEENPESQGDNFEWGYSTDSQTSSVHEQRPEEFDLQQEEDAIINQTENAAENRVPVLYPVGQAHGTYIIAQNNQGLYLIDQHAAQERIKYEFYREKVGIVPEEVQELLVPLTFEFSKQETIFIQAHQEELKQVGLFFEPFGEHTFIIRSHPQWLPKGEEEETIREMVDQVLENQKVDIKQLREDAAILMSCKRSIKANHHLNYDDMYHLLEDLRQCQDPFTCPHGRPIIIFFSEYDLEKMFKRVM